MIERVRGSAVLRWGLLLGGIGGLAAIGQALQPFVALSAGVDRAATYSAFLIYLALYFAAGVLTVRAGRPVSLGAIAGLLVAVVSQALGGLVLVGIVLAAPLAYARSIGQEAYAKDPGALALTAVMGLVIALLVYGTFGAAMGALGGLVLPGKRASASRTADTRGA
jgi:hypothetical protein